MKKNLNTYCVNKDANIKNTMEIIDKNLIGAALVIDENNRVIGIVTDGDIRRALINGRNLNDNINGIYNKSFKYVNNIDIINSKNKAKEIMLKNKIRQLPVLDNDKKIVDLYFIEDLMKYDTKDNYVLIMAGGLGTRLRPLTENIPKPMLKVGGKPILELIINQFKGYGFSNFLISINYKGEIIENYFKDGKDFGVNIQYIRETKKLGTAGSIKLAENKLVKPFIVINGDILTGVNFDTLLNYHNDNNFDVTVGVRNYEIKVPYGVMVTDNTIIKSIEEKPVYNFYINSGIYVLNPNVIHYIPKNRAFDMTDVINKEVSNDGKSGIYSITEYWTDIGRIDDYYRANEDIKNIFLF